MEDKVERNTQVEELHEKRLKKFELSLRELQGNMKCDNIQIIRMTEEKKMSKR